MKRNTLWLLSENLVFIAIICGFIFASDIVLADNDTVIDQVNVTVEESCTLAGVGMDSHVATLNNAEYSGQSGSDYVNGIGKTTLTAFCNDYNGFSIYAIGFTGDSYTDTNHTKLVGATDNNNTISTGLYTSGDTTSSWAMKIDKITDGTISYIPANMSIQNSFDSWYLVPDTYTKVAQYHANSGSSVTDTVLGGKLETTYQAYVSASQAADTYEGKVKYTLIHPYNEIPVQPKTSSSGKICYYPNTAMAIGTMGCQTISDSATSATLYTSNFSRTGYGFAGWSDAFDYATNANAHFFGPNENITFTAGQYTGSNPGLSLYAVWVKSQGDFQDQSLVSELCDSTNGTLTQAIFTKDPEDESIWSVTAGLTSVSALTDTRDNQTYAIAKLPDGKCWMIENLRLDDSAVLTTLNTNNPLTDNDLSNPTVTLKHNYIDSQTYSTLSPSSNVAYNADTAPNGWCVSNAASCVDQSRLCTDNITSRTTFSSGATITNNAILYSYGNYYNFYSTTAGHGIYSKTSGRTAGDICPFGWHVPSGSGSGEYALLSNSLGGYNINGVAQQMSSSTSPTHTIMKKRFRSFPNNFIYGGFINGGAPGYRSRYGHYWTSTSNGNGQAYYLYLYNDYLGPGTYSGAKYSGRSVRCMATL